MGGRSSKNTSNDTSPPLPINTNSEYTSDLNSYEAACLNDPDLQSCDANVHERISRILNTLATGADFRSLSFDALIEVTDFLLETDLDVAKLIMEYREDIWKNKEMFNLVKEYFDNSLKTMDFCTALENCLRRSSDSQMIVKLAVKKFEEEEMENKEDGKYEKTLEQLGKFKAAGDPFTEEFIVLFRLVYRQQLSMFHKLQQQKRKLDKKLKSLKSWRKLSNIIFITAFASVLIFSVVAAAISAPPVIIALSAALAVPMGPVGKWCSTLWNRYLSEVKGKRELISSMQGHTYIVLRDFENIRTLVSRLEIEIHSLLLNADLALREEDAMKLVIDEINKKVEVVGEMIENLSKHASRCNQDIAMARTVILLKIFKHPLS